MVQGQAYSGFVDFPVNLRNLRNFLQGCLPNPDALLRMGVPVKEGPVDSKSVLIKPDPTSFMAIRDWLQERDLLKTRRYAMFGRIGWTTHSVRIDKVMHGMRFTFDDDIDAVMFKMTWDLGS